MPMFCKQSRVTTESCKPLQRPFSPSTKAVGKLSMQKCSLNLQNNQSQCWFSTLEAKCNCSLQTHPKFPWSSSWCHKFRQELSLLTLMKMGKHHDATLEAGGKLTTTPLIIINGKWINDYKMYYEGSSSQTKSLSMSEHSRSLQMIQN